MPEYYYDVDGLSRMTELGKLAGESVSAFSVFNQKVFAEGALSKKTKELIAVAAAHITRCPYCIDSHVKKAKAAGATDQEIAEAIMVAVAMNAGASLAHGTIAVRSLRESE